MWLLPSRTDYECCGFLATNPTPSADEIDTAMQGNICRCGTYQRIKKAIGEAAFELAKEVS